MTDSQFDPGGVGHPVRQRQLLGFVVGVLIGAVIVFVGLTMQTHHRRNAANAEWQFGPDGNCYHVTEYSFRHFDGGGFTVYCPVGTYPVVLGKEFLLTADYEQDREHWNRCITKQSDDPWAVLTNEQVRQMRWMYYASKNESWADDSGRPIPRTNDGGTCR